MVFAGAARIHLLKDSSVVHLLEDSSVVLVGSRAYYMLIVVVVVLLLVLVVRMSPAALPGRFVGGSIARSRFLTLLSRDVVVPQAFVLFATIASPSQMYAILLLHQKCIRPAMSSSRRDRK